MLLDDASDGSRAGIIVRLGYFKAYSSLSGAQLQCADKNIGAVTTIADGTV